MTTMNKSLEALIVERERYQTSHGLHLILTLMTGGLWAIVWWLMWMGNNNMRKEVNHKIKLLEKELEESVDNGE
tara:strand:- start:66918 stop:67139 length:222 start_codon:yes stop_codon:yes gene_type:complete